jgi:hypothetical protein
VFTVAYQCLVCQTMCVNKGGDMTLRNVDNILMNITKIEDIIKEVERVKKLKEKKF